MFLQTPPPPRSFAAAFHILMRKDQQESESFSTFLHTVGSIFAFAVGGPDMGVLWNSHVPTAATILCMIYNFTIAIVLLNLLIAVMTDAYSRVGGRRQLGGAEGFEGLRLGRGALRGLRGDGRRYPPDQCPLVILMRSVNTRSGNITPLSPNHLIPHVHCHPQIMECKESRFTHLESPPHTHNPPPPT